MLLLPPPDYPVLYNNTRTRPGEPLEVRPRDVEALKAAGWSHYYEDAEGEDAETDEEIEDDDSN